MTNTHNTVAIDFGYTRTKMAFYNSHDEKTQIMEFRNGSYYMPTSDVAVIRESGEPIVGDKFEHAFENMQKNSEKYIIVPGFKTRLTLPIGGNSETPMKVLKAIFTELLNEVTKHPAFNEKEPITAYVTHPPKPIYTGTEQSRLEWAAEEAGFAQVHLVEEPKAVIRAFQVEGADLSDHLLILDCGGLTLDICYLHRLEPVFVRSLGKIRREAEGAPVGGKDLDNDLVRRFREKYKDELKEANIAFEGAVLASVRRQVRSCKEQYSLHGKWKDIKVSSPEHPLSLSLEEEDLNECVQTYIDNVCKSVLKVMSSEMPKIEEKLEGKGKEKLSIQLVGGSSRFPELPEILTYRLGKAFDNRFEITVFSTGHRAEYATVLGALHIPTQSAEEDIGSPDSSERFRENKDIFSFYDAPVSSIAFSPDGKLLATAADQTVMLWDVEKAERLNVFTDHGASVTSVAFSDDRKYLATAAGQVITLWDREEWSPIELVGHTEPVTSIAFSPNNAHLASSSKDNTIKLWNVDKRKELKTIEGHQGWINSVSWSLYGEKIASAGQDMTIQIYTLGTDRDSLIKEGGRGHDAPVNCVTHVNLGFYDEGKEIRHCLLSGDMDGNIKVWRASDNNAPAAKKYSHHLTQKVHVTPVTSVAPFHNLENLELDTVKFQFATGGRDGTIELWRFHTKFLYGLIAMTPILQFACFLLSSDKLQSYAKLDGHDDVVTSLTFSPNQRILVSGSADKTVKMWDIGKLTNIRKAKDRNEFSNYKTLSNLAARQS